MTNHMFTLMKILGVFKSGSFLWVQFTASYISITTDFISPAVLWEALPRSKLTPTFDVYRWLICGQSANCCLHDKPRYISANIWCSTWLPWTHVSWLPWCLEHPTNNVTLNKNIAQSKPDNMKIHHYSNHSGPWVCYDLSTASLRPLCVYRPIFLSHTHKTSYRLWPNKQRVLMHRHQGWNVRHGLCHIYMRYLYIYELFIAFVCFVVCSLL